MEHVTWQDYKPIGVLIVNATLDTSYHTSGSTMALIDSQQPISTSGLGHPADADLDKYNQLLLYVKVALGSATDMRMIIDFSPDNEQNWYQETSESISGGTATMTQLEHVFSASGNYIIAIPIKYPRARIRNKVTGTATGNTCTVTGAVGVQ